MIVNEYLVLAKASARQATTDYERELEWAFIRLLQQMANNQEMRRTRTFTDASIWAHRTLGMHAICRMADTIREEERAAKLRAWEHYRHECLLEHKP